MVAAGGFAIIFGLIIAILWILMPFAIFGTKDKLQELINESKITNQLLQKIIDKQ